MTSRPTRVIRSSELRARRGKPRASQRGELDDLSARLVKTETHAFRNLRGDAAALQSLAGIQSTLAQIAALGVVAGTFTPVANLATPGTSSFTISVQEGTYTRVGPRVDFFIRLVFDVNKGTGADALVITGLPFDAPDNGGGYLAYASGFVWPASLNNRLVMVSVVTGSPPEILFYWGGTTTPTTLDVTSLRDPGTHVLYFGGSYITDDP